jgi:hypothetical protein
VSGYLSTTTKGDIVEEKEGSRSPEESEEVEAQRFRTRAEGAEPPESELGKRESDDDSDVEAHNFKAGR